MIHSIAVLPQSGAKTWPRAAIALITIATPGIAVVTPPGRCTLHLVFDTLAGELEVASLRVSWTAPAVPFAGEHARAIADFVSRLQRDREPIRLLVCESEGYVRSVTIGRWAAKRIGCPLHEPAPAAAVASCMLMDRVLDRVPDFAREVSRRMPVVADWAMQP